MKSRVGIPFFLSLAVILAIVPVIGHAKVVVCNVLPYYSNAPSVAYAAGSYLVAWEDGRPGSGGVQGSIYAARVTPGLVVIDENGFQVHQSAIGFSPTNPKVATNGAEFLVVWEEPGSVASNILGARVSGNQVLSSVNVCTAPGNQCSPGVAFNGTDYLVAWAATATPYMEYV